MIAPVTTAGPRLLLLEDDANVAGTLTSRLTTEGYVVTHASSVRSRFTDTNPEGSSDGELIRLFVANRRLFWSIARLTFFN